MSTAEEINARRLAYTQRVEADHAFLCAVGAALEAEATRRRDADPREPAMTAADAAAIVATL